MLLCGGCFVEPRAVVNWDFAGLIFIGDSAHRLSIYVCMCALLLGRANENKTRFVKPAHFICSSGARSLCARRSPSLALSLSLSARID
jgi:hypothetical protein